jgi:methionyl-tRNA formyltransferase
MRIVILTYESLFSNLMVETLIKTYPDEVFGVVYSDFIIQGKSLIQSLLYLRRRSGLRFVSHKALLELQLRTMAFIIRLIAGRAKINSLRDISQIYAIPLIASKNINSYRTLAQIRAWKPDIIFSIYLNQLIEPELIGMPSRGIFNIHPSLLPRHRGVNPFFWMIKNQETEAGVTIHWVDENFDTGDILLQRKIKVEPRDSILSLSYKSSLVGAEMLCQAVKLIESGNPARLEQDDTQASYHTWPTPEDQLRFRSVGGRYGSFFELWRYLQKDRIKIF